MRRRESLFLIIREGSDLNYLDVKKRNKKHDELLRHRKCNKFEDLSTGYNSTKKVEVSARSMILTLALRRSCQRTLKGASKEISSSVKSSWGRTTSTVEKKRKEFYQDIHSPTSPTKTSAQISVVSGYFVDEQKQDAGSGRKVSKKLNCVQTTQLPIIQKPAKECSNVRTQLKRKEFVDKFYGQLGTKQQSLNNFQEQILDAKFHLTGKPLQASNDREVKDTFIASPGFPVRKNFSRSKLSDNRLQLLIESSTRTGESTINIRRNPKLVVDFASDIDNVSDTELEKSKTHLDESDTKSTKSDSYLLRSRLQSIRSQHPSRKVNSWVTETAKGPQECRSTIKDKRIEIFLPTII